MKNPYLELYEKQIHKLDKNEYKDINLKDYPYLQLKDNFYVIKNGFLLGQIDNKKNFGFLRQEYKDVYIDGYNLKDAMHDDIVIVKSGYEPKVVYIVERALKQVIATYRKTSLGTTFQTDINLNKELIVLDKTSLVLGHVVLLDIEKINDTEIYAKINKIIGHINDPDIEIKKIVTDYKWPSQFNDEIFVELDNIAIDFDYEKKTRTDFTNLLTVTIDGIDAKDLDDAISLEKLEDKYKLGIHIADVSYYVKENSALDKEAYLRGTSAYLANTVIPMLPHKLSNDLCSLNEDEERLALSVVIDFDLDFNIISHNIFKSIIKTNKRLNYDEVNAFLKDNISLNNKEVEEMLENMYLISNSLKQKRQTRGEIEFNTIELGFDINDKGEVTNVYERTTDEAEELIESFMLVANEVVAEYMFHLHLPMIYRVHDNPDLNKLKNALTIIERLGIKTPKKRITSAKVLQNVMEQVRNSKFSYVVNMQILRAMQKAIYSDKNLGHFGLQARYYTHFTAPIRRYPDLMVHRMLHMFIFEKKTNYDSYFNYVGEVSEHSSTQERKAMMMERDVDKLKSVEYMSNFVDEIFEATIVEMSSSGMFVKLNNGIEGFVPLRLLDDYYTYNEYILAFVSSKGKKYRLGDKILTRLLNVDLMTRRMDFTIIDKKGKRK